MNDHSWHLRVVENNLHFIIKDQIISHTKNLRNSTVPYLIVDTVVLPNN